MIEEEQVIVDDTFEDVMHRSNNQSLIHSVGIEDEYGDYMDTVDYEIDEELYDEDEMNGRQSPDDGVGVTSVGGGVNSRAGKSLGMLTQRFIRFLQQTPAGLVDLNTVGTNFYLFLFLGCGTTKSYSKTTCL